MIISIHIPKTAGVSFQAHLQSLFGARMLLDYGDWVGIDTPEANERRTARVAEMRAQRDGLLEHFDLIYGHFAADKYADLFPVAQYTAFFRDPYQQMVSLYEFFSRSRPGEEEDYLHPGAEIFHQWGPTLPEFIASASNVQTSFLGTIAVEDMTVVGLTEQYERSVSLFGAAFNLRAAVEPHRLNANPDRGEHYEIDAVVRAAVDRHCAADVETYRKACEQFAQLTKRFGL
jgi:hypothetical protein